MVLLELVHRLLRMVALFHQIGRRLVVGRHLRGVRKQLVCRVGDGDEVVEDGLAAVEQAPDSRRLSEAPSSWSPATARRQRTAGSSPPRHPKGGGRPAAAARGRRRTPAPGRPPAEQGRSGHTPGGAPSERRRPPRRGRSRARTPRRSNRGMRRSPAHRARRQRGSGRKSAGSGASWRGRKGARRSALAACSRSPTCAPPPLPAPLKFGIQYKHFHFIRKSLHIKRKCQFLQYQQRETTDPREPRVLAGDHPIETRGHGCQAAHRAQRGSFAASCFPA